MPHVEFEPQQEVTNADGTTWSRDPLGGTARTQNRNAVERERCARAARAHLGVVNQTARWQDEPRGTDRRRAGDLLRDGARACAQREPNAARAAGRSALPARWTRSTGRPRMTTVALTVRAQVSGLERANFEHCMGKAGDFCPSQTRSAELSRSAYRASSKEQAGEERAILPSPVPVSNLSKASSSNERVMRSASGSSAAEGGASTCRPRGRGRRGPPPEWRPRVRMLRHWASSFEDGRICEGACSVVISCRLSLLRHVIHAGHEQVSQLSEVS